MGCWNETCVITNLPIRHENECVFIDFNPKSIEMQFYEDWSGGGWARHKDIIRIIKGHYNDYGSIDEFEKEDEKIDRDSYVRVFFLKSAWDTVVANVDYGYKDIRQDHGRDPFNEFSGYYHHPDTQMDYLEEAMKIMHFCRNARIDPYASAVYGGCQHEEVESHILRHKILTDALTNWVHEIKEMEEIWGT